MAGSNNTNDISRKKEYQKSIDNAFKDMSKDAMLGIQNAIFDKILKESGAFDNFYKQTGKTEEQKDMKPHFRLFEDIDTSAIDNPQTDEELNMTIAYLEKLNELVREIIEKHYLVEIIEDLDVTNIASENRYFIRITNNNSKVFYEFDLIKFRENLLDYDFSPEEFISDILKKIEGTGETKFIIKLRDIILEYLSYGIHNKIAYIYEYSKIGWDRYSIDNKTRIFKYDYIISRNENIKGKIKKSLREELETSTDLKVKGEKDKKWYAFTIKLMNNHMYDSLLFSIGISGLVRQILTFTKETNLNVNVLGKPGSGKSTIGHYILSFFGKPNMLEGSSIDTENAMDHLRVKRPVLPYVLDERMLRFFGNTDNRQRTELLLEVFREYEGKEKERLGKQYENNSGNRIYGPIISSSVDSMMNTLLSIGNDLGQYRRFMEFNIKSAEDAILFNADEVMMAEDIANDCYGYGVRYVVNYMLYRMEKDDKYFEKRFEEIRDDIQSRLQDRQATSGVKGLTSSAMRFALISLSYEILRESLIYKAYSDLLNEMEIAKKDEVTRVNFVLNYFDIDEDTEIKIGNLKFEDFLNQSERLLSDKKAEIEEELIVNLVNKLGGVVNAKKHNLKEWLIENYNSDSNLISRDYKQWDINTQPLCIIKEDKSIKVYFVQKMNLDHILLNDDIPTIEEINNMFIEIRNNDNWKELFRSKDILLTSNERKDVIDNNGYIKKTRAISSISGKGKNATEIIIKLAEVEKDSEEEEKNNEN